MNYDASLFSQRLIDYVSNFSGLGAYGLILGMLLLCGFGVPIPEDITIISAGLLVSLEQISMGGAIAICLIGVLAGDSVMYFLGRKFGRRIFGLRGFRSIFTPARIAMAEKKVLENSRFICFSARFLPGLRAPIFLTAGVMGVSPWVFLTLDGIAALISVPALVVLGWWFGENIDQGLKVVKETQIFIFIGIGIFLLAYLAYRRWKQKPSSTIDPK